MRKNSATARTRAAPPSPAPRPTPRASLLEFDLAVLDGVGLAGVVVPVDVVVFRADGVVEKDDDDDDDEVVEEEETVVEDDALLVTLKYCDLIRGPRL